MREAKRTRPGWTSNEEHEAAVQSFARALLTHREFLRDFEPFQRAVADAGEPRRARPVAAKLTVPGVPDIYQGDELLCLRWSTPTTAGRSTGTAPGRAGSADPPPKLQVILRALALRARRPEAFAGVVRAGRGRARTRRLHPRGRAVFVAVRLRGAELPRPRRLGRRARARRPGAAQPAVTRRRSAGCAADAVEAVGAQGRVAVGVEAVGAEHARAVLHRVEPAEQRRAGRRRRR